MAELAIPEVARPAPPRRARAPPAARAACAGPSTLAVHGGEPRPKPAHALATPIVQTATYTFAQHARS